MVPPVRKQKQGRESQHACEPIKRRWMPSPNSRDTYSYGYREWEFPTLGFVLEAHDAVIGSSGGSHGIEHEGYLASAPSAPLDSAFGDDACPGLFDKTVPLCFRLAKNHGGFIVGNKRTALITAEETLSRNGHEPKWTQESRVLGMSLVGSGFLDQEGLRHALAFGYGFDPAERTIP